MAAKAYYTPAPPYPDSSPYPDASPYHGDNSEPPHYQQHEDQHLHHPLPWDSPPHTSKGSSFPSSHSSHSSTSSLKPLHLVQQHGQTQNSHLTLPTYHQPSATDAHLKSRIRHLRLLSRVLALILSILVFIPITMTLHKFLTTNTTHRTVTQPNGNTTSRTPWANNSKLWPTWMYFLIAAISLLLNAAIILAYFFSGVKGANRTAFFTTTFTSITLVAHLIVWSVGVTLYRTEKDSSATAAKDLWGWSCSPAARAIQDEFKQELDFGRVCALQSWSWYIGILQVGLAGVAGVVLVLGWKRKKERERAERMEMVGRGFEPVR